MSAHLHEALALLPTRDMRFYGDTPFDNRDATELYLSTMATPFDAKQNDTLTALYAQVLPTLAPVEQGSILVKLRRCPAVPQVQS